MNMQFFWRDRYWEAMSRQVLDISIPLRDGLDNPNCFWAPAVEYSAVVAGTFVGSTALGGVVNFKNVRINPHGNGTHTECVGHISTEAYSIRTTLTSPLFVAKLVTLLPTRTDEGDRVIFAEQIHDMIVSTEQVHALVVRTLPNDDTKLNRVYSGTNPPYFHHEALQYLAACGIEHLLTDLPSVDREEDGGLLLGHKAFWQYPHATRTACTITELIYVPNSIKDGYYLLNLQTASFDLDVSPSKPLLYPIVPTNLV